MSINKNKLLYFMPDNPIKGKAGNITRLCQMLSFFNDLAGYEVTFVSLEDWGNWEQANKSEFKANYPNIKLLLLDKKYKKQFLKYLFGYKIPYLFQNRNSIDLTSLILRKEFHQILNSENFDYVIISYASWGNIVQKKNGKTHFICDTHDFITGQNCHKKNIGSLFQSEISELKKFDEIWTYSVEEEYIFGQFTDAKVTLMPISFPINTQKHTGNYLYDVVFVGSENPHNVAGIHWFLKNVLPLLKDIKIHILGKVGNAIKETYPNVKIYGMVDDIENFYTNARLAICPMLSGTGIKIKVLEALSYGLPVVTNRRGIDGLINKTNNGCVATEDSQIFANEIIKLINDDIYYQQIKSEGISYFEKNHNPEKELSILNHTFLKLSYEN